MSCSRASAVVLGLASILILSVPASAQQPPLAGTVLNASHAQLAAAPVTSGATVFSGDLFRTDSEGTVQVQVGHAQFVLLPDSSLRIFRIQNKIVVELERGAVNYATAVGDDVTLYASDIRIVPVTAQPSSGQVAITGRCQVRIASERGSVNVTSGKETKTINEGQATSALSEIGVDYRDSWKPVLADYPDFDPQSQYHKSHTHAACPVAATQKNQAPLPGLGGHFKAAGFAVLGAALCIELCRPPESGDGPK